jgi:hypothetical protein
MDLNSEQTIWIFTIGLLVIFSILLFYFFKDYNFKKITLIVVLFITIILCVISYNKISKSFNKKNWPPSVSKCPDYWIESQSSSGEIMCKNEQNLGKESCPKEVNLNTFTQNSRLLANDDCEKAKWAKACSLSWDGITNKENVCN